MVEGRVAWSRVELKNISYISREGLAQSYRMSMKRRGKIMCFPRFSLILLICGLLLIAFSSSSHAVQQPEIRVARIVGSAQVFRAGAWNKLSGQDIVSVSERIRTPRDGEVFLDLGGIAAVRIGPEADLRVASLTVSDADRSRPTVKTQLNLGRGRAWLNVRELSRNSSFKVRTPVFVAGVRGTSFAVGADGPDAGVGVVAGSVDMSPAPDTADFPDAVGAPLPFTPLILGARERALVGRGEPVREVIPDEEWKLLNQELQELGNTVATSRTPQLPAQPALVNFIAVVEPTAQVKQALEEFFTALEAEKIGDIEPRVAESFFNNDQNQFRYGRDDFLISVQKDFDHLDNIAYRLRVKSIEFSGAQAIARLTWDRRATISTTRSEWLIKDQSSILTFDRSSGDSSFLLARIDGDAIVGLSSSYSGVTLVTGGSLNNVTIDTPLAVGDNQALDTATSALFPDVLPVNIGLTSPATTGPVIYTINADTTIGAGQIWTLNSGDQVNVAAGVLITVANGGEINANGATFTNKGALGNWNGLYFTNTGGANSLINCIIKNADTGIFLSNVTAISISSCQVTVTGDAIVSDNSSPTLSGNTIRGTQIGILLSGGGTVSMSSNTVTNSTGFAALAVVMPQAFTGTMTSVSDVFTASQYGALIVEGGGTFTFTSSSFTQNTLDGFYVQLNMGSGYTITSCQFNQNGRTGLWDFGGAPMSVASSNFINNTDTGVRGGGFATMNNCYLSGNNGAVGVDMSIATPNSGSTPPQYAEMAASGVTNPSATPN